MRYHIQHKKGLHLQTFFVLSYLDSNQDKQNQNLLCYHYTIGQSSLLSFEERCKDCASESKSNEI